MIFMGRLIFLGSGGGGRMLATQERKTGGIFMELGPDFSLIVDPGPGSLVNAVSLGLAPEKCKGLLISHHHLDAVSDSNALIECMSDIDKDNNKFPFVIAQEMCLSMKSKSDPYPYITKYHQDLIKKMCPVTNKSIVTIENFEVRAAKANHYAPTVGFLLKYGKYKIGYPADGSYYPGQEKHYEGSDVLILNIPWPKGYDAPKNIHMTIDDAISFVKAMEHKPKLVVLTHLSQFMLRSNMYKQEKILADSAKVRCISAEDFMELNLDTLQTRMLQPVARK